MKFRILLFLALAMWSVSALRATVTLQVSGGTFFQPDGSTLVPEGSFGVLVVDTDRDGFLDIDLLDGFDVLAGEQWGNEFVLGVFQADSDGAFFNNILDNIDYSVGGLTAGDPMAFYWFPEITSVGGTIAANMSWGRYRNDNNDVAVFSDIGFLMPADSGGVWNLYFAHSDYFPGALGTLAEFTATAGVSAVPEPSTYAIFLGMAVLGVATCRRRKLRSSEYPVCADKPGFEVRNHVPTAESILR